jgi:hypothetical protein
LRKPASHRQVLLSSAAFQPQPQRGPIRRSGTCSGNMCRMSVNDAGLFGSHGPPRLRPRKETRRSIRGP